MEEFEKQRQDKLLEENDLCYENLQEIDVKIKSTAERYTRTIEEEKEKRKVYFQKIQKIPEVKKEIDEKKDYDNLKYMIDCNKKYQKNLTVK